MSDWFNILRESEFDHVATVQTETKITNYLLATEIDLFCLKDIWISLMEGKPKLMFEYDAQRVLKKAEEVEFHEPAPYISQVL